MRIGKLKADELEKYIFKRTGYKDPDVLIGSSIGEDAAIIKIFDDKALVAHTDPITGSLDLIGFLSVVIPSNDVAVRGVRPRWMLTTIFLPPDAEESEIDRMTSQIHETANMFNISIVGGHTEYTDAVKRPVIISTAIGVGRIDKIITTGGAKPGEKILMTKTVGIEGTAILARDFKEILIKKDVDKEIIEKASSYYKKISVIEEALKLAEEDLVSSMHDPTEGGLLAGLAELAYASKVSITIYEDKIPMSVETKIISKAFDIDPLTMLSSGALIASVKKGFEEKALKVLREIGVEASIIGEVEDRKDYLVKIISRSGERILRDVYIEDPVIKLFNIFIK